MENKIEVFNHEQFGQVRTIVKDGEPWFVGKDVATALGYTKLDAMYRVVDDMDKWKINPQTLDITGFPQNGATLESNPNIKILVMINESGLYQAIFNSTLPTAKKFKHWVTSEVLPSIRKHGAYATPETIEKMIADPDNVIKIFTALKEEREKRVEAENLLEAAKPKLSYYEKILASKGTMKTTQIAKDYGMSAQRLNKVLNEAGFIWKCNGQWVLYAKYDNLGYVDSVTYEYDGGSHCTTQTVWTQRGRLKIHQILTSKGFTANCDKNNQFRINTLGKQEEFNAKSLARQLA